MKKYIIPILFGIAVVCSADAAVKVKNHTADNYIENNEISDDAEAIAILENDIRILDEEIAKCKKQKKGWIAATVVGSVGTVATGTAAVVQGVKLKDKKDEYENKKAEYKDKQKELKDLQ